MKGFALLTLSIVSEVFATTMLKLSDGFTLLLPSVAVACGYALSFYSLSHCLKKMPLSMAYAIWSGAGTILTTIIGILVWGDPFNMITAAGIALILGGVLFVNSGEYQKTAEVPSD